MMINQSKLASLARLVWRNKMNIVFIIFTVNMLFFDEHSLVNIARLKSQEVGLEREIAVYKDSLEHFNQRIGEVSVDEEALEHFARERLHMRGENEDLFLLEE